jgi:FAD:protein FMN transferase
MGTTNTVVVSEGAALPAAMAIVQEQIEDIENACSRFRANSEISRLNRSAGSEPCVLSPLLEEAVTAALAAAEMTDGLVDLTVGGNVEEAGYTVTFRDLPEDGPAVELLTRRIAGWRALTYDPVAHTLQVPAGVAIDLGASGKAWAADVSAAAVAGNLGISVLVECGGDIAVSGPSMEGGWPVRVALDQEAGDGQDILVFEGGLATSGTTARSWRRGGVRLHHIIDPATGLPAQTPWVMVSAAAATCVEANAVATAALIMGERAIAWLDVIGIPSRLVTAGGDIRYAGGWSA